MMYKNILLTGGSGNLGTEIIKSNLFSSLLSPSRDVLDITNIETIKRVFDNNKFDAVIHCAAFARMKECEKNPEKAIKINVIGTSNLVNEIINRNKNIRFIQISTDGVYPGTKGNYSEKDATFPYNKYCWTKLAAESSVNMLSNFCIIRTSFFNPKNIPFDDSPVDSYTSKMPINDLVKAIHHMLNHDFIGTINIGDDRKSFYNLYSKYKQVKPIKFEDVQKNLSFKLAKDASLDISLWKKIKS